MQPNYYMDKVNCQYWNLEKSKSAREEAEEAKKTGHQR